MEIVIACLIFFGVAVVFYLFKELQDVDKNMWVQNNTLKQKITQLEAEIISLNKDIKAMKEVEETETEK